MSKRQDVSGNALEYAVARQMASATGVLIKEDSVSEKARQDFESETISHRQQLAQAADVALKHIFALEKSKLNLSDKCMVVMQPDSKGQVGDPRDIVLPLKKGELGLSVKRNNDAVKNPRLQRNNPDFFAKWGLQGTVSDTYCDAVEEVFLKLDDARKLGAENWNELSKFKVNLYEDIFAPLISSFIVEFRRGMDSNNCANFTRYMLGNMDYYKIIAYVGERVVIQGINLNKKLSCSAPSYPKELMLVEALPIAGRVARAILTFEGGWVYTMRLHNAKTKLEDSLKWDVRLIANPIELYVHHIIL